MGIQFQDAADITVEHIVCTIYGAPNVGKTTLALTAERPAILDFDGGVHRAGNKTGKPAIRVNTWADVAGLTAEDLKPYKTIIVDTIGTCLDTMAQQITRENAKHGTNGALTLPGYGVLKQRFRTWLDMLRESGLDVVLVAHGIEEQRGDETVDRIVATGGSKQEVYQQSDISGRITIMPGRDDARILTFNPTSASYGKNIGLADQLVREPSMNPTLLGDVIAEAKTLMDTASVRQSAEHDRVAALRQRIQGLEPTGDAFNIEMETMKRDGASTTDARLLLDIAKDKCVVYNREHKVFESPEPLYDGPMPAEKCCAQPLFNAAASDGSTSCANCGRHYSLSELAQEEYDEDPDDPREEDVYEEDPQTALV